MTIAEISLYLSLFFGIYGGFHVYVFYKLKPFFLPHTWLLISLLVLLGGSIFLTIALGRGNVDPTIVAPLAYVAFIWMGMVFLFFALSASFDLFAWVIGKIRAQRLHSFLVSSTRTTAVGIAVTLLAVYGHIASLQIHVERLVFESPKITTPVKVVQITDLHLGLLSDEGYFRKVVDAINALDADVVVSTGDLVDMQMDHLDGLGTLMSSIQARRGKYAILGNHEALAGIYGSRAFIERAGFRLLSNGGVTIDKAINLVGVDDPEVQGIALQPPVNEPALLKQFENGLYTILLKHQPVVEQGSIGLFDLQLSGHTHGGQILPFNLLIHLLYKAPFGLSQRGDNGWLYVSRGTGTWGPPMRIMAKPEITLIRLQRETTKQ